TRNHHLSSLLQKYRKKTKHSVTGSACQFPSQVSLSLRLPTCNTSSSLCQKPPPCSLQVLLCVNV
ncbi:unnamed protein product, partial [Musa acuminata subsp. burmannicoides]